MEAQKRVKNIRELADILNLSVTTVSRVLNGKSKAFRISSQTSEKVLKAASEMNYSANKIARGLKLEKTETLGLIIPDVANPFFASIAKIIDIEARKNGYSLILCDSLDDIHTEKELLLLLQNRKVDGLIIAPVGNAFEHIEQIRDMGTPVMVVDRYFPRSTIPYVTTNNYSGACKATEYIISQGHTRIACIQGVKNTTPNSDRVKGYTDTLEKYHIPFVQEYLTGEDFGIDNGYKHAMKLLVLPENKKPTAIFALSNLISLGILKAARELNIEIPDQLSLVSFDEQPYSAYLACPMTTVEQIREDMASMAVKGLLEMIHNQKIDSHINILLEPRLIIRDSVKKITP